MQICIKDIRPGGIEVAGKLSAEVIGERKEDLLKFVDPLDVKARLERIEETILAHIGVTGKYSSSCSRCLEAVESNWHKNFDLDFEIERKTKSIELEEDIRQEIILSLPRRVLCGENCKGLCPDCGVNLNNIKCKCLVRH